MTTPDEFRKAFVRGVVAFPPSAVGALPIAAGDADWLVTVGLPRSAPPFLSFGGKPQISIPTVTELWGVSSGAHYRVIGSTGSGDPIAIDTAASGQIVYLNHDNHFQRVFINSSVMQLAESLFAYRRLIEDTQSENGPNAYLDRDIPAEVLARFESFLRDSDPPALVSGMWADELEQLKDEAG